MFPVVNFLNVLL